MKFIVTLLVLITGVYFGADYMLGSHFKTTPPTKPEDEKALVQNMAKFLEQSPDLQKKITDSGQTITKQSTVPAISVAHEVDLSHLARYFGSSPSDQFFKKYLTEKKKMNPESADEQSTLFVGISDYIHEHPKEAIESLENALQAIPLDMTEERSAIVPAFIHSSIGFIEELGDDEQAKKTYLKRFINNTQDPEIKDALESHFPDILNPPVRPPEPRREDLSN